MPPPFVDARRLGQCASNAEKVPLMHGDMLEALSYRTFSPRPGIETESSLPEGPDSISVRAKCEWE